MTSWLEQWYKSQCDGDWEHMYGIRISTIDNPGWSVKIDLSDTDLETLEMEWVTEEKSHTDWVHYQVSKKSFVGVGGPLKLKEIIDIFERIWKENTKGE